VQAKVAQLEEEQTIDIKEEGSNPAAARLPENIGKEVVRLDKSWYKLG
jgi:hypothetical protein